MKLVLFLSLLCLGCSLSQSRVPSPPSSHSSFSSPSLATPSPVTPPNSDGSLRTDKFPYQLEFDTISYMSCPRQNISLNFPTLQFSSFKKGIRLTKDFESQFEDKNSADRLLALQSSPFRNSTARIAITDRADPAAIVNTFTVLYPPINHPTVLKRLSEDGVSYYLQGETIISRSLPISGAHFISILPSLSSNFQINLTYSRGSLSSQEAPPIGPTTNQYYGRSFDLELSSEKKYLTDISEFDLLDHTRVSPSWSCKKSLKFMILRHERISSSKYNANEQYFEDHSLEQEARCKVTSSAVRGGDKKILDLALPKGVFAAGYVEVWDEASEEYSEVSPRIRCLVPKSPSYQCYEERGNRKFFRIEWDESRCDISNPDYVCPSFFSICTK